MNDRLQMSQLVPDAYRRLADLNSTVEKAALDAGLDAGLIDLVRTRASQLNGCAYCADLHSHDARKGGESEQRVLLVSVWREAGVYTEAEQAAFELTEALTTLAATQEVPDAVYERAAAAFTPEQYGALAWVATTINTFNRLGVLGRMHPPVRD